MIFMHGMIGSGNSSMKLTTKQLKQIIKEELRAVYEGLGDNLSPEQRVTLLNQPLNLEMLNNISQSVRHENMI